VVVISHAYKLIFIKTVKTAGTSMEACLSRCLPATDSLTPIYPPVDCHQPRNWDLGNGIRLRNHMPMSEVLKIYNSEIADYKSWCVERHPIDKCISHYAMLINSPQHNEGNEDLGWAEYIESRRFPIDIDKWSIGESAVVDKIFDYSKIRLEVPNYLFNEFGIPGFSLDATAKSGFRKGRVPICDEISSYHRSIIMNEFEHSNSLLRDKGLYFE
jgi:hypothetical protein